MKSTVGTKYEHVGQIRIENLKISTFLKLAYYQFVFFSCVGTKTKCTIIYTLGLMIIDLGHVKSTTLVLKTSYNTVLGRLK